MLPHQRFVEFAALMINDHHRLLEQLMHQSIELQNMTDIIVDAAERDALILTCGNGGSCATATHLACDLAKTTECNIRAIPLTSSPIITAVSNDTSPEDIFSAQIRYLGRKDDVLIIVSSSGNSINVVKAAQQAKDIGMCVISLVGWHACKLAEYSDVLITVGTKDYKHNEPLHDFVIHMVVFWIKSYQIPHKRSNLPHLQIPHHQTLPMDSPL